MFFFSTYIFILIVTLTHGFDSLLDNSFYSINWKGPIQLGDEAVEKDNIFVTTNNHEKYQCILPKVDEKTRLKNEEQFSSAKLEIEYLRPLIDGDVCTYRLEIYWTYELCHSKHIRQFHEEKEFGKPPKIQEYFLGKYGRERFKADLEKAKKERDDGIVKNPPKKKKVLGDELPYYEVIFEDGTTCDLTGNPRRSHVQFICQSDGKGEIYELKETSSCEYEVVVLTSLLCQHPIYGPKVSPVHSIDCHPVDQSPIKPSNLNDLERQSAFGKYNNKEHQQIINSLLNMVQTLVDDDNDDDDDDEDDDEIKKYSKLSDRSSLTSTTKISGEDHPPQQNVDNNDRHQKHVDTDPVFLVPPSSKHILREFLSGDYCIEGGTGWWKHEFCYGKYIRQFHDDQNGRHVIKLGNWDEGKHLKWIDENPLKRPKPVTERRSLYNLYHDGDYCDEVKKNRMVEVRFDCNDSNKISNSISLYLLESSVCEYKLIVESSLFCELIKTADEDGLIHFKL